VVGTKCQEGSFDEISIIFSSKLIFPIRKALMEDLFSTGVNILQILLIFKLSTELVLLC